jgi:phosphoribosylaminoimidazole-succinocarboxamide synthase
MSESVILQSNLPRLPVRRGKVRDIYDLGDALLLVSTDRISAFDWVLPTGIPDKGRVLTQLSAFWFDLLGEPNHMLSTDVEAMDLLPDPIFTPATKEESGHDINVSFERMVELVGRPLAEELRRRSVEVYTRGAEHARKRGIIIADTKFEWGQVDGELILIDEVLTPDSSRFWPADQYRPGGSPPSFDKQFVRDWLETTGWDKNSPPPPLPADVVARTRSKYVEAYQTLTERAFGWK